MGAEGGWRLDERRRVAEGAEPSLLGQQLLVGHGVGEGEGGAGEQQVNHKSGGGSKRGLLQSARASHLSPPTDRCP